MRCKGIYTYIYIYIYACRVLIPSLASQPAFSSEARVIMPRLSKRKKKVAEKEEGLRKMTDETKVKKAKKKKKGIKKKRKVTTLDDGQNFTDEDLETFRLCGYAFLEIADHKYMGAWRRDVENFLVKVVQELSCEGSLNSQLLRRALAEEFLRLRPIINKNLIASSSGEDVPQSSESRLEDVGDNRC